MHMFAPLSTNEGQSLTPLQGNSTGDFSFLNSLPRFDATAKVKARASPTAALSTREDAIDCATDTGLLKTNHVITTRSSSSESPDKAPAEHSEDISSSSYIERYTDGKMPIKLDCEPMAFDVDMWLDSEGRKDHGGPNEGPNNPTSMSRKKNVTFADVERLDDSGRLDHPTFRTVPSRTCFLLSSRALKRDFPRGLQILPRRRASAPSRSMSNRVFCYDSRPQNPA
jgi:hypothetical protein